MDQEGTSNWTEIASPPFFPEFFNFLVDILLLLVYFQIASLLGIFFVGLTTNARWLVHCQSNFKLLIPQISQSTFKFLVPQNASPGFLVKLFYSQSIPNPFLVPCQSNPIITSPFLVQPYYFQSLSSPTLLFLVHSQSNHIIPSPFLVQSYYFQSLTSPTLLFLVPCQSNDFIPSPFLAQQFYAQSNSIFFFSNIV